MLVGELRRAVERARSVQAVRLKLEAWGPQLRRILHVASPLFLLYYTFPSDTWIGIPRELLVLGILLFFLVGEVVRIWRRWRIPGLRAYEADQISAFTWGGMALALALLIFPMPLVVPAVVGMAWVDPLCARTRGGRGYPWLPLLAYGLVAGSAFAVEAQLGWLAPQLPTIALLTAVATATAIAAEAPRVAYVDDDFRMLIVPLAALEVALVLLQHL